jgi:hypothetical protein
VLDKWGAGDALDDEARRNGNWWGGLSEAGVGEKKEDGREPGDLP